MTRRLPFSLRKLVAVVFVPAFVAAGLTFIPTPPAAIAQENPTELPEEYAPEALPAPPKIQTFEEESVEGDTRTLKATFDAPLQDSSTRASLYRDDEPVAITSANEGTEVTFNVPNDESTYTVAAGEEQRSTSFLPAASDYASRIQLQIQPNWGSGGVYAYWDISVLSWYELQYSDYGIFFIDATNGSIINSAPLVRRNSFDKSGWAKIHKRYAVQDQLIYAVLSESSPWSADSQNWTHESQITSRMGRTNTVAYNAPEISIGYQEEVTADYGDYRIYSWQWEEPFLENQAPVNWWESPYKYYTVLPSGDIVQPNRWGGPSELIPYIKSGTYGHSSSLGRKLYLATVKGQQSYYPDTFPTHVNDLDDVLAISTEVMPEKFSADQLGGRDSKRFKGGVDPSASDCSLQCHGDPVNSYTGEYFETSTDVKVDGALPLLAQRTFATSSKDAMGPFGLGSTFNYGMKLKGDGATLADSETVTVVQENSSELSYWKQQGIFYGETVTTATLEAVSGGKYHFKRKDGTTFVFDAAGKLEAIQDRKGNQTFLFYSSSTGKLDEVRSGRVGQQMFIDPKLLTFTWSGDKITSISNGLETATYSYTGDRLTSVTLPGATAARSYSYDAEGRVATITHPNGGVYTNSYNGDNRVTQQEDPRGGITTFAYSAEGAPTTTVVTKPDGSKTLEEYNAGNLTKIIKAYETPEAFSYTYKYDLYGNRTSEVDPDGQPTTYTTDAEGNVTSISTPNYATTRFTYNGFGQVVETVAPDGGVTTNGYDAVGNLISTTDPLGHVTTYEVHENGSLKSILDPLEAAGAGRKTQFSYDAKGYLVGTTTPEGSITATTNDVLGAPLSVTDAMGIETTYSYNAQRQLTAVELPNGAEVTTAYDSAGRVTETTDALGRSTTLTYDSMDNVLTSTDGYGTTAYEYDSMQRPTKITAADGAETLLTYNAIGEVASSTDVLGNITTHTYRNGLRETTTDALGGVTTFYYDSMKNLVLVYKDGKLLQSLGYDKFNRHTSTSWADGNYETSSYNTAGYLASSSKGRWETTTYEHDALGRLTKTSYPNYSQELRSYDADGQLTSVTDRDGAVTTAEYDAGGRLTTVVRPDQSEASYSYTTMDQLQQVSYDGGATVDSSYTYDLGGRVSSETKQGVETTYSYDAIGNMTRRGPPTGGGVSYAYDQYGKVTGTTYPSGLTLSYGYDALGNLTTVGEGTITHATYGYDALNRPTTLTTGNGVVETRGYDSLSQLTSLDLARSGTSFYGKAFTYNNTQLVATADTTIGGNLTEQKTYSYDHRHRLSSAGEQVSGGASWYGYDTANNLTSGPLGSNSFTGGGQLTSAYQQGQAVSYTHDARGNRTAKTAGAAATTYEWTADNKLSAVTLPGSATPQVSYSYDAAGLLTTRTQAGATEEFVWDTLESVPTLLEDGENAYIYGLGSAPVAQVALATNEVTYLHGDERGSVIAATASNGDLQWTRSYDEYGAVRTQTSPLTPGSSFSTPFAYAGEYQDSATGLYNLRARWYEPETGSFISQDPALLATGEAYSYASGNPLRYTDPLGLWSQQDTLSAIVGAIDGASIAPWASTLANFISPGSVSTCSLAYKVGNGVGAVGSMFIPGYGQVKALAFAAGAAAGAYKLLKSTLPSAKKFVSNIREAFPQSLATDRAELVLGSGSPSNIVYRALAKGETPGSGLTARSPGADVTPLSHVAGKKDSSWISTTKDVNTAKGKYNQGNGVVAIDLDKVPSEIVDISSGIPKGGRFSSYAKSDQEVLIKDYVPADAIVKWWK